LIVQTQPLNGEKPTMTYLSHWNPIRTLLHARPNLDVEAYLRGFEPRVVWAGHEGGALDIRLDLSEDEVAYHVKADIPGVDRNDIDLRVDGNTIHIAAEVKRGPAPKPGEKEIYSERFCGLASRTFSLPGRVDETKVTAHYENGVLTLTLPKKSEGQTRKIAID